MYNICAYVYDNTHTHTIHSYTLNRYFGRCTAKLTNFQIGNTYFFPLLKAHVRVPSVDHTRERRVPAPPVSRAHSICIYGQADRTAIGASAALHARTYARRGALA